MRLFILLVSTLFLGVACEPAEDGFDSGFILEYPQDPTGDAVCDQCLAELYYCLEDVGGKHYKMSCTACLPHLRKCRVDRARGGSDLEPL